MSCFREFLPETTAFAPKYGFTSRVRRLIWHLLRFWAFASRRSLFDVIAYYIKNRVLTCYSLHSVSAVTMFLGGEICSMSKIRRERVEEKFSQFEQSKTKKTEKHVHFEVCYFHFCFYSTYTVILLHYYKMILKINHGFTKTFSSVCWKAILRLDSCKFNSVKMQQCM